MHIGLIGGIGPAATIAYYSKLVETFKSADIPLELTIDHAQIASLVSNASVNQKQSQAEIFKIHLDRLAGAGCDAAMITSLTGHFCFEQTQALSPIPLINGTKIIDDYCNENGIGSIGLLGSPPVLSTHMFGLLNKPRTIVPDTDKEKVGAAYMELANTAHCSDENRRFLIEAGAKMVSKQGAQAILLAGTDLGLAFDGQQTNYQLVDALALHVTAMVDMAANS